jgi:hypothetical protein
MRYLFCILCVLHVLAVHLLAQQAVVTTPATHVNESFYESFGTQWGVQGKGWFFNWGGGGGVVPPFGGFDPAAGGSMGFGFGGNGISGNFGLDWASGNSRSITSTSPSVTLPNGGYGGIIDTTYRPFITEITPVVGESGIAKKLREYGRPPYRLEHVSEERLQKVQAAELTANVQSYSGESSATRGANSLAEIRRFQAAEDLAKQQELATLLQKGAELETAGDFKGAASYYAKAAVRMSGTEQAKLMQKSRQLRTGKIQ